VPFVKNPLYKLSVIPTPLKQDCIGLSPLANTEFVVKSITSENKN
jgi:hypothetical protein